MLKIKLSPYAKLFYTEWLLDSSSGRYNITIDQTLCGVLDVARLGKSLHRYVTEHLLLNSHIQEIDGEPYWVENDEIKELEYLDNHVSTSELLFYVSRSFDLHREPLYRFRLLFIKKGVYRLILVFHHLVVDGSSSLDPGVFAAISNYYNDDHYTAKYSIKEQAKLISDLTDILNTNLLQNRTKYTEFWHQQLQDVESIDLNFLKLGRNDGSPNVVESENPIGIIKIDYGDLELANLNQIKERYGVTPYSYGGSIFALLLHRYTGQERLAISYPIAIREGIDFIYGAQINTNLMPYQFTPTTTITDLLNQNKEFFKLTIKNDLKYGYYPIADIIQEHQNKQLLDICFAQTCFREHPLKFNGITKVEPSSELSIDGVAKNILLFEHNARGNKLEYRIRYDQRVINEELLNNFVASYKKLFSEILAELAIVMSF